MLDWERKSQVIDTSLIGVVAAGTNLGNAFLRCTCKEPLHCIALLAAASLGNAWQCDERTQQCITVQCKNMKDMVEQRDDRLLTPHCN